MLESNSVTSPVFQETVVSLFERQVRLRPGAIALVGEFGSMTYEELNSKANQLAHRLLARGIGKGDWVGILLERSADAIIAILAALKSGAGYLPLDIRLPDHRIHQILQVANPAIILSARGIPIEYIGSSVLLVERLPSVRDISAVPLDNPKSEDGIPLGGVDDGAYLIFTSGSTGLPKGVEIEHRSLSNLLEAIQAVFPFGPEIRHVGNTTLSFDISVLDIFGPLTSGGALVVVPDSIVQDTHRFLSFIQGQQANSLQATPSYWMALVRENSSMLAGIRRLAGGESFSKDLAFELLAQGTILCNGYGPTETTIYTTAKVIESNDVTRSSASTVSIGRPLSGYSVRVLGDNLQPQPVGITGEIYISGIGLARGYWGRPGLTAERFIADPYALEPGGRMYRTGDLGRWGPDGQLDFLGRVDHQVKIRGFRIELEEIESNVRELPGISQVAVVAREDGPGGRYLAAYVVLKPGESPNWDTLQAKLRTRLPEYMVPATWIALTELPLTVNGKLNRAALPAPERLQVGFEAPRSNLEREICDLFAQVLGLQQVGRNDHFFQLGGHSLRAVRLISLFRTVTPLDLQVRALFEAPTPATLALRLANAAKSHRAAPPTALERPLELPLSFAQERLWLVDKLQGVSPEYHLPHIIRIQGPFHISALEQAFQSLVDRHESLRTRFEESNGQPVQIVESHVVFRLPVVDFSHLAVEEGERELNRLLSEEASRPFDLRVAPLIRAQLFHLSGEEYVLSRTCHHIVSDGWSEGLISHELGLLYRSHLLGTANPLKPLELQYPDYALWQRKTWTVERQEKDLEYWKRQLAPIPENIDLPSDHPRPTQLSHQLGQWTARLPAESAQALRELGRQQGSTLFSTLLSTFGILLSRYSGKEDIVVGTPSAGRSEAALEALIGFFVNTLVFRLAVTPKLSFSNLLKATQEMVLDAFEHENLPFQRLVQELAPVRSANITPLFQVLFALQNNAGVLDEFEGTTVQVEHHRSRLVRFDLELHVLERSDGLEFIWLYQAELFDPWRIEQMANHFLRLLTEVLRAPAQPISELSLLSPDEQRQLLQAFQPDPAPRPQETIVELFERQVDQSPEAISLIFGEFSLSYSALNHCSNFLARALVKRGVSVGNVVGFWAIRGKELLPLLLGILKAGAAYLPLDPDAPLSRTLQLLELANPFLLLQSDSTPADLPPLPCPSLRVIWNGSASPNLATSERQGLLDEHQPAYIVFTSGSTGTPKGVVTPHRGVIRLVKDPNYMSLNSETRMLHLAPVSFDAATLEIWGPLLNGGIVILAPPHRLSTMELGKLLRQFKINTLWLTSGLFHEMVDSELVAMGGLNQLLAGGDVLSPVHVKRFRSDHPNWRFINGYGPTETTTFTSCHTVSTAIPDGATVPIGRPINSTEVLILDQNLQVMPPGIYGEIYVSGAGLALGYQSSPGLTAERFIANPFGRHPGQIMYRTGDLGRWQPNGVIEFLGRADQQVKIRGFRIELAEIERRILTCTEVAQVAVVVIDDTVIGKFVVAYVVPATSGVPSVETLRAALDAFLPAYMIPSQWMVLDHLPLNHNGKVNRRALPPPVRRISIDPTPISETEGLLCQIFAEVLHLNKVGCQDDFFRLGGHSLLAVRLVTQIKKQLGIEIPVGSVFRGSTPRELARTVEDAKARLLNNGGLNKCATLVWFDTPPWALEEWPADLAIAGERVDIPEGSNHPEYPTEAFGQWYVDRIDSRKIQSPIFAGFCRVGLIALEAAYRHALSGKMPPPVILVDTFPPGFLLRTIRRLFVEAGNWLGWSGGEMTLNARRILHAVSNVESIIHSPKTTLNRYFFSGVHPFRLTFNRQPSESHPRDKADGISTEDLWQFSDFTPRVYPGPVVLLLARGTPTESQSFARKKWSQWCPNLTVDWMDGNHESCVREHAPALAAKIAGHVRRLSGTTPTDPSNGPSAWPNQNPAGSVLHRDSRGSSGTR